MLCRVKVLKFKFLNLIVLPCLSIVIRDIRHVKNGQNILALTLIHVLRYFFKKVKKFSLLTC